jgi:hypothetical protein
MGILEILTLIFVVLKLAEVTAIAQWDWIWVFSPMWIGYGAALAIFLLTATFAAIVGKSR